MWVLTGCLHPRAMPNFPIPASLPRYLGAEEGGDDFLPALGAMPVICFAAGLEVPIDALGPPRRGGSSSPGVAAEMLGGCVEMVAMETGTTGDGSIMGGRLRVPRVAPNLAPPCDVWGCPKPGLERRWVMFELALQGHGDSPVARKGWA